MAKQTTKEKAVTKQLILRELMEITELWFDTPIMQHLVTIMRPYKDSYFWTDEMLLKKIEKYRAELEDMQQEDIDGEQTADNGWIQG